MAICDGSGRNCVYRVSQTRNPDKQALAYPPLEGRGGERQDKLGRRALPQIHAGLGANGGERAGLDGCDDGDRPLQTMVVQNLRIMHQN
jgi:hypothetical protein